MHNERHNDILSMMKDMNRSDMSGLDQVPTYQSINLLLVYFGSVDLSFLDACNCVGLTRLVIIENHLPHQHHQLM